MAFWRIGLSGDIVEADTPPTPLAIPLTDEQAAEWLVPHPTWWDVNGVPVEVTDGSKPRGTPLSREDYLAAISPRPKSRTITSLTGVAQSHATDDEAAQVQIYVLSPTGGSVGSRPTINGQPVAATSAPYTFGRGESLTIETNDASNDLVIVEEF